MINRKITQIILGQDYIIYYDYKKPIECRFIQPTEKGFNFLNLATSKCILKHHIYPLKSPNYIKSGNWFFVNPNLTITKKN